MGVLGELSLGHAGFMSVGAVSYTHLDVYKRQVEYKTTIITDENGKLETIVTVQDKVVGTNRDKITLLEDKYEAKTFTGTFDGNDKTCLLYTSYQLRCHHPRRS